MSSSKIPVPIISSSAMLPPLGPSPSPPPPSRARRPRGSSSPRPPPPHAASSSSTSCFWVEGSVAGLHVPILIHRRQPRSRISYSFAERAGLPLHVHSIAAHRVKVLIVHDMHISVAKRSTVETALAVPDAKESADLVLGSTWCKQVNLSIEVDAGGETVATIDSTMGRTRLPIIPTPEWWSPPPLSDPPSKDPLGDAFKQAAVAPMSQLTRSGSNHSLPVAAAHRASPILTNTAPVIPPIVSTPFLNRSFEQFISASASEHSDSETTTHNNGSRPLSLSSNASSDAPAGHHTRSTTPAASPSPRPELILGVQSRQTWVSASPPLLMRRTMSHEGVNHRRWNNDDEDDVTYCEEDGHMATGGDFDDDDKMWESVWASQRRKAGEWSAPPNPNSLIPFPSKYDKEAFAGGGLHDSSRAITRVVGDSRPWKPQSTSGEQHAPPPPRPSVEMTRSFSSPGISRLQHSEARKSIVFPLTSESGQHSPFLARLLSLKKGSSGGN